MYLARKNRKHAWVHLPLLFDSIDFLIDSITSVSGFSRRDIPQSPSNVLSRTLHRTIVMKSLFKVTIAFDRLVSQEYQNHKRKKEAEIQQLQK